MSYYSHERQFTSVELVQLEGFAAGGLWSNNEGSCHKPYLAPVPLSRYLDPEDHEWDLFRAVTAISRRQKLAKSRHYTRLAGPHWMQKKLPHGVKPLWETEGEKNE